MTDDERYAKYEREYDMIARLQEAYAHIGRAANEFESLAELDEDCEVRKFEDDMEALDETAHFSCIEPIQDIAWYIDDRSVLEDMGLDTSWWERGDVDMREAYRAEREGAVNDCE